MTGDDESIDPRIATAIEGAARRVDLEGTLEMRRVGRGANNRAYVIRGGARRIFAKCYWASDEDDGLSRFARETEFLVFADAAGLRMVPRLLDVDRDARLAIFEFVDGSPILPNTVTGASVEQALEFLGRINEARETTTARSLGDARESAFSVSGHVDILRRRLAALERIQATDDVSARAIRWVAEQFSPWCGDLIEQTQVRAGGLPCGFSDPLALDSRCLSPSDFGFHNAMALPDGRLVFYDFEYAGWDDPAKLVGDFYWQPAVPAPRATKPGFSETVVAVLGLPDWHRTRFQILDPVFGARWCCIMLNEFLDAASLRRSFALGEGGAEDRRVEGLERACRTLDSMRD